MILRIFDTETTGVAATDKVVEIAWIDVDENLDVIRSVRSLIDPEIRIPPQASGVHGIVDSMVESAPTLEEFFSEIEVQSDEPVLLIAHNAEFDAKFVEGRMNVVAKLCTLRLARHLYPFAPDFKLQTLRYLFGVSTSGGAHGAADDCETTRLVLKAMLRDAKLSLDEAAKLARSPVKYAKMPFGRHRDTPLSELSFGYRAWLLKLPDLDPDLRYSLENA